ncbi:larval cuticle protein A3A [Cherax quadricarinatus]|uniref:larval cuticle protein A3A n=1 Tax=Cherax quadricarinatus TaxID=27406 RepID=UPI00387E23B0
MLCKAGLMGVVTAIVTGTVTTLPQDTPYGPAARVYARPAYQHDPVTYHFSYAIKDDYVGTDYDHNEKSDGANVKGSYSVALPDGRRQTVSYVADPYGGYLAQVTYKGQAQHPQVYGPPITFRPLTSAYRPQLDYQ